jgi:hypothetical protein
MADEVLYLMTLYKEGKRIGMEISDDMERLTERAKDYKEFADQVKFWKCEEIKKSSA